MECDAGNVRAESQDRAELNQIAVGASSGSNIARSSTQEYSIESGPHAAGYYQEKEKPMETWMWVVLAIVVIGGIAYYMTRKA